MMRLFDSFTAWDTLADLFDREREAILTGRFDILERLGAEKERLFRAVQRQSTDQERLAALQEKAARNQELLRAMERGVRSAASRIEALRKGAGHLNTYGADGQSHPLNAAERTLHRRA